jgi:hypothetical protein
MAAQRGRGRLDYGAAHGKSLECLDPGGIGEDFDDHGSIFCPRCNGRVVCQILMWWGGFYREYTRASTMPQKVKDVCGSTSAQKDVIPFVAGTITVSDDREL